MSFHFDVPFVFSVSFVKLEEESIELGFVGNDSHSKGSELMNSVFLKSG
jgi:hypothetical protein